MLGSDKSLGRTNVWDRQMSMLDKCLGRTLVRVGQLSRLDKFFFFCVPVSFCIFVSVSFYVFVSVSLCVFVSVSFYVFVSVSVCLSLFVSVSLFAQPTNQTNNIKRHPLFLKYLTIRGKKNIF